MGQGGGALFLVAQMSQNSVERLPRFIGYDVLVINTSNDFDGPAAATADLNIDVEHTLEPLCPGHSTVSFSG